MKNISYETILDVQKKVNIVDIIVIIKKKI